MSDQLARLIQALNNLPEDSDMIEHNPDDGPSYHCCGQSVQFHIHPSRWQPGSIEGRMHGKDCWYVELQTAFKGYTES